MLRSFGTVATAALNALALCLYAALRLDLWLPWALVQVAALSGVDLQAHAIRASYADGIAIHAEQARLVLADGRELADLAQLGVTVRADARSGRPRFSLHGVHAEGGRVLLPLGEGTPGERPRDAQAATIPALAGARLRDLRVAISWRGRAPLELAISDATLVRADDVGSLLDARIELAGLPLALSGEIGHLDQLLTRASAWPFDLDLTSGTATGRVQGNIADRAAGAPSAVRFAFDLASANPGEQLERFGLPAQGLPALALSGRARIGEGRVAIDADRIAFGGDAPLAARAVWDVRAQPAALSVSIDNQRLVLGDIVAEPVSLDAVLQGGRLQLDVHAFALPARALAVRGSYGSDDADGMALELAGDLHGEPFRLRGRTAVPWRHAGWRDGTAVFPVRGQLDYRDARLAFNGGIDRLAGAASAMHADLDLRTRKSWRLLGAADDGQSLAAPFNAAARLRLRGLVAELSAISLTAGDSALGGRIEVDVTGELPVVDGALHGERVHMHDLRALWPTGAGDLDREPDAPIRLPSPERLPLRGALLLSVDRLVLRNAEISTLRAGAVISDDELTLELARADLWNGRIAAAFERRRGRDAQMRVELNDVEFAYFRNQDADQARLRAPFDFVATITGQGEDIDAFIGSANGNIGFAMGTGTVTIPGLDFLGRGLLEVLIPGFRANPTVALNCAAARFDLDGGVLASRGLVIDLKPVTIGGGGVIDFNQELLEIALVPRAKRRQFISLVAPVHITGSLSNPRVETELQGLTVRALGDLLLASIAPWLLVVPLIVPADDPLQQAEVCLQAIADQNDDPPALIDQAPRRYPSGR